MKIRPVMIIDYRIYCITLVIMSHSVVKENGRRKKAIFSFDDKDSKSLLVEAD